MLCMQSVESEDWGFVSIELEGQTERSTVCLGVGEKRLDLVGHIDPEEWMRSSAGK